MSDDKILTIREVTILPNVGEKAIYAMAQVGNLPEYKVHIHWKLRRSDIDVRNAAQVEHAEALSGDAGGNE